MAGCRDLTLEEIVKIATGFRGKNALRNKTLFLLGCNTGFRISELCSLMVGDVLNEFGDIVPEIDLNKARMKGKKKGRVVSINPGSQKILEEWLPVLAKKGYIDKEDPLFPTYRGRALDRVGGWRIMNRAAKICRLPGKVATHSMRKTFAMRSKEELLKALANGEHVDVLTELMEIVGHSDPRSTVAYLSDLDKRKKNIIDKISIEV